MYIYNVEMAPIFLQILKDREAAQHEILRDKGYTVEGNYLATTPSNAGIDKFERAGRALRLLLAARHRIESESFGKCEACATAIDLQRLIALPADPFCLPCESKQERRIAQANNSHKLHLKKEELARNGAYKSATQLSALQSLTSVVEEVS